MFQLSGFCFLGGSLFDCRWALSNVSPVMPTRSPVNSNLKVEVSSPASGFGIQGLRGSGPRV